MPDPVTRTGIKICGLTTEAAIDACVAAGIDWAGLVFYPRSPRALTAEAAIPLVARLANGIVPVGLFVTPTHAEIERVLARVSLGALQIYDTPSAIDGLRAAFDIEIWHAVPITARNDLPRTTNADRLLVEAKAPPGALNPGGNGAALDWTILQDWQAPSPWMLAGGLDHTNVARAIAQSRATAVDVSSGVERAPGVKDPDAIHAFVAAVRAATVDQ